MVGKWFMVDVEFVIDELAESLTLRAPPDFLLAATGEDSECFLVEHSLPNLENCTVYPGQTSERTGPIIALDFSNPLEPQNSYTKKQDWYLTCEMFDLCIFVSFVLILFDCNIL